MTICIAIIAAWFTVAYAKQPLLEAHGFRQTQTAITAYWMLHEGWQLDYQTPVGGYPWSIPFEFPIYQSIVALIAWLGNFNLDPVGRLVSFAFLIACAWPAFVITRKLQLRSEVAWVFCALLWSSPLYLFWGRTFMIETTAIFFAFAAIPYALDMRDPDPRWQSVLLFMFWAILGLLQKVTTSISVLMIMGIVLVVVHLKNFGLRLPSWKKIFQVFVAFSIPVIIAGLWSYYTDMVKGQSALGIDLTSSALTKWNFGTIDQRLTPEVWGSIIWNRALLVNAAGFLGVALLTGIFITGERRIKSIVLTLLILFLLPILIFTNLHFVHDYYQVSSVIFLLGAIAVAIIYLFPDSMGKYPVIPGITWIFVISNLFFFVTGYGQNVHIPLSPTTTPTLAVSEAIRTNIPEDSGIVIFGADWNSEISYYSERKSFSVPEWSSSYDVAWKDPASFLGDKELGAVVYCIEENKPFPNLTQILERPDIKQQPNLFKVENCYLWIPKAESITLPSRNKTLLPMNFLDN